MVSPIVFRLLYHPQNDGGKVDVTIDVQKEFWRERIGETRSKEAADSKIKTESSILVNKSYFSTPDKDFLGSQVPLVRYLSNPLTPAKPKEKKRKPVSESSEAQPLAKRAKAGKVVKKRTVKSSKQLVDEFVDEGVPAAKPSLEDTEEAILQKVLEESLTDAYPTQRGPLPPVVFRETDTGKFQPLPEVPGKGKEKVGEEQAAQVLLNLQTPKKKSSAEQYILQRRSHIPTATAGREDSTSLYAELGLYGSDTESDEEMPSVVRSGAQDEGQAGSDPGTRDEGQAGPNPDDVAESLPLPTPCVLAGPNLEHSDVEITDPSSQPQPEHMDEGFTATAYPDVQENLKLTVDEQVIPEEPVSSTGTLSSLQHLAKDFSFGDQFLNDKPSEADDEKTTADTEAESMVSVTIQQDTSIIPPMTSPVIDLMTIPDSPNVHWPLPTTTTTTTAPTTTTTTALPLPPQPQQGSSDSILIKRMGELEQHIANLAEENQALETRIDKQGNRIHKVETMDWPKVIRKQTVNSSSCSLQRSPTSDMKEILLQRMLEENYEKGHAHHRVAYEALHDSIHRDEVEDFDSPPPPPPPPSSASGASGTTRASDSAQAPPPPPPSSSTHQGDQSTSTAAPSSSKTAALAEYSAWITTDTRVKPSITTIPDDLYIDDETTTDEQAYSSGDEVGRDHIPTVNLRQSWWKPLTEDRPATPEPAWTIPSSDLSMPTNNWASALKLTYAPPQENSLLAQTRDMATFIDWYCKQQGISKLTDKCMDKSKITRKQSKTSKPGHENQKSTRPKPKPKSFSNPQGPFLHIPKVIYNLKRGKEREGPKVLTFQTTTVLTVEEGAGNTFTIHPSSSFHPHDYLVFDDVAAAILKEENRCNNREDRQTSSRQVEALVVIRGRSIEPGSSGSHNHAAVANEGRKRFAAICCNDHELKIIGIGSIMVKMHDGTVCSIRDMRHVEGLKKNLLSLGQLDDLGCKVENTKQDHENYKRRTCTYERRKGGYKLIPAEGKDNRGRRSIEEGEPSNLQEAMNNPDASFWKEATQEEI
ncbi:hypothetical protein Tco_1029869 [Tanacetum coccineum]|uniref:Retrovirus-related Pol polyprotein from transposon TNT 1-94-like beta-barrel domain-containing protein n=1 Tax=Tanacetum coccineum TaxID=301880 RepID=A0ABQ5G668_9ASTR